MATKRKSKKMGTTHREWEPPVNVGGVVRKMMRHARRTASVLTIVLAELDAERDYPPIWYAVALFLLLAPAFYAGGRTTLARPSLF